MARCTHRERSGRDGSVFHRHCKRLLYSVVILIIHIQRLVRLQSGPSRAKLAHTVTAQVPFRSPFNWGRAKPGTSISAMTPAASSCARMLPSLRTCSRMTPRVSSFSKKRLSLLWRKDWINCHRIASRYTSQHYSVTARICVDNVLRKRRHCNRWLHSCCKGLFCTGKECTLVEG